MKKGQIVEGTVKRVKFPNKGVIEIPGEEKSVLVKNVVPGQKIRVAINKVRKGQTEGRLLEVTEKAPEEINPSCPHFGFCGGCTYQNLSYEHQLQIKAAQVKEMMDQAVCGDYIWEGITPSPVVNGYRNKMEFTFGDEVKNGPMSLGMHKRGSFHDVVSVLNCQIVDADYRQILKWTLKAATDSGMSYYHRMRHTGFFRHLLVRKAVKTGEILIVLITASGNDADNPISSEDIEEMLKGWKDQLLKLSLDGKNRRNSSYG